MNSVMIISVDKVTGKAGSGMAIEVSTKAIANVCMIELQCKVGFGTDT